MIVNRRIGIYILLKESLRSLIALFAWDLVIVILFQLFHKEWMEQPALPISFIGSALALFMNLRNNAAYSRWWEGRSLWGLVTNNARSFGRQVGSLLHGRPDLACAMAAYAHSLRGSLGDVDVSADVARLLPPAMGVAIKGWANEPNAILYQIGLEVDKEVARQKIDGAVHGQIDRILSDMANAQGGLERIRKTPLAIQFSGLPRFLAMCFCLVLPMSMVQSLGWITPLGSSLIGFLFIALDKIGFDLEEPFRNNSPHALPMRAMARTIEIDLLQPIGLKVDRALQPQKGVLD